MKRSNKALSFLYVIMFTCVLLIVINVFLITIFRIHPRSLTSLDPYIDSVSLISEKEYAQRGVIYDNSGQVIASDLPTYDIICYLDENRVKGNGEIAYVDNPSLTASLLAPILGMETKDIFDRLTSNRNLYQVELGAKGRNLSTQTKEEIEAIKDLHGIGFRKSSKRNYTKEGEISPQLVGFAKADEYGKLIGQLGIEAYLNDELSGIDGSHVYQQDKNGYILPGMYDYRKEPIDGYDVYLTLNISLQQALNECLAKTMEYKEASEAWGAIVEINTGKILAWGQTPSYNPNDIKSGDVQVNYGSQIPYEAGSVAKSLIYSAAIDLGVYDGDALYDSGPYCYRGDASRTYGSDSYGCIYNVSKLNWGSIPLDYGLIYSSNVATATLLTEYVGIDRYKEYLDRFHMYQKVNTDGIDEVSGITHYGLSPSDDITASYGMGSTTTMLQLLQAYTAIFGNGEMLKPYLIDKIVDPNNNDLIIYQGKRNVVSTPISQATAKKMQDLLRRVVSDEKGTCRHYAAKTVEVMGKTGTTELLQGGEYSSSKTIISCMVGFPYEDPQYMIYYAYKSPQTVYYNYDIKPIPDLIDQVALLQGLTVDTSGNENQNYINKYEMIDFNSNDVKEAIEELKSYDVNTVIIGDGDKVIDQYPKKNDDLYSKSNVFLLTNGNNITIPDFKGFTRSDIINYWNLSNIPITINGYGVVVNQSIEPFTIYNNQEIVVNLDNINVTIQEKKEGE